MKPDLQVLRMSLDELTSNSDEVIQHLCWLTQGPGFAFRKQFNGSDMKQVFRSLLENANILFQGLEQSSGFKQGSQREILAKLKAGLTSGVWTENDYKLFGQWVIKSMTHFFDFNWKQDIIRDWNYFLSQIGLELKGHLAVSVAVVPTRAKTSKTQTKEKIPMAEASDNSEIKNLANEIASELLARALDEESADQYYEKAKLIARKILKKALEEEAKKMLGAQFQSKKKNDDPVSVPA